MLLLLALVTTAAAISQVWTRLQVIQYGYKISEASKERSKLREKNRRLRVEIAVLKNPARIAQIASEQFGLQQPLPKQIHRLRPAGEGAAPALVRAPR